MVDIVLKRAYSAAQKSDGGRVLVDRLWPRGIKKEDLAIDEWYKDIAPSKDLRQWFDHDPEKWGDFRKRYLSELSDNKDRAKELLEQKKDGRLTLVYAAKDEQHNHARVIREYLRHLK